MLTAKRLKELLSYDSETGIFTWKASRPGPRRPGSAAGTVNQDGYIVIGIDGRTYLAHRLAWLYVHGVFPPPNRLDHENRQRADNRIANLREATPTQNGQNRRIRSDNESGLRGVRLMKGGKWRARITIGGRLVHLGCHETSRLAAAAYDAAARKYHGEFANPNGVNV